MIFHLMRWQELARLDRPLVEPPCHHLFNLMPGLEIGLSTPEVTRLCSDPSPLAGRRAVHLSDLHLTATAPGIAPWSAPWPS